MRTSHVDEFVEQIIAEWPPPTEEQIDKVASILITGSRNGGAANE